MKQKTTTVTTAPANVTPTATATAQPAPATTGTDATPTPSPSPAPEPTSELLTKLQDDKIAAGKAWVAAMGTPDENNAKIALDKIVSDITAEKKRIVNAEREQREAEERNAILSLLRAYKNAKGDEAAKMETELANKLLSGTPKTRTASASGNGNGSGRGAITAEIKDIARAMLTAGTDGATVRKHIIHEKGYNDGTANAAILAVEKELKLK